MKKRQLFGGSRNHVESLEIPKWRQPDARCASIFHSILDFLFSILMNLQLHGSGFGEKVATREPFAPAQG